MRKTALFALAALTPLAFAAQALAADAAIATAADAPTNVEALIVTGEITYRNRTEDAAPVLSYDQEYFQRFEPVSAGDAMKRVPSVTFLSDVLESDGARLRGLDPGYTQILINGEKVPGALADRSFFVDRIPAELLDRIEIIRAPSANRSGDAVAGALNIVLRDALTLNGGYVRGGVTRYDDDKFAGNAGVYWGGEFGPGRLLIGANVQGRRAPKEKTSWRYKTPGGALDNIEVQTDVRDGTDYSFNASYDVAVGGGDLTVEGFFVRTDRLQDEDSWEYKGGVRDNANLLTLNDNDLDILTDSWSLRGKYVRDMLGGRSKFKLGYSELKDDQYEFEQELEFQQGDKLPFPDADRFTRDETRTDLKDSEFNAELEHERDLGFGKLTFGVQYVDKDRDNQVTERRNRFTIANGVNSGATFPAPAGLWTDRGFGKVSIEETRIDPYVMLNGKTDLVTWEVGLRYETTETKITDNSSGVAPADRVTENDYAFLLPSANFKFRAGENGRVNFSIGRTVRRPNFDSLQPILLADEYGDDQDFIGNPNLKPETAWGLDLGYERRLPGRGVVGVNVFYRQISDLIEEDLKSQPTATPQVFTVKNVGDGKVWGVEFDLSTPLTFVGLENTGVFLNYSWLDSDISDRYGSRKFNDQSNYVFNVGFIQDLPSWEAAFGVTYRKQGNAWGRVTLEEVRTEYGGDLEMFIEKRIGERLVVRLTGQNLLDASKDEVFDKFGSIEDQIARKHDEYEIETEKAGPVFQLTARYAF